VYEIFNIKVLKGHDLEGNNKECGVSKTPTAGAPGSGKGDQVKPRQRGNG
jgi:hypothetical protein